MHQWHDGVTYDHTVEVGKVYDFSLQGVHVHPFHLHVNPFQIVSWGDTETVDDSDGWFAIGDWQDTLLSKNKWTNVRFQTDYFAGKMVSHCHILAHEDLGMMAVGLVTGTDGTVWDGARTIDPTCYRTAEFAPPTIISEGDCPVPMATGILVVIIAGGVVGVLFGVGFLMQMMKTKKQPPVKTYA
jgi:hypothetical protein